MGGVVAVLLLVGAVGTAIALRDDQGGRTTTGTDGGGADGGGELTGRPSLEVEADGETLVFTMTYDGFSEGDRYEIKNAPTRDNFGPATAYSVTKITDGTGTYRLPARTGTQWCGQVQVVRDVDSPQEQRSEWSEIVCATGKDS